MRLSGLGLFYMVIAKIRLRQVISQTFSRSRGCKPIT